MRFIIWLLCCCFTLPAHADEFRFVFLGDVPYGPAEKTQPRFDALIDAINQREPELVIHVGDTKSGNTPCDNDELDRQLENLNRFNAPTLYTPGDNEWADCHTKSMGQFNPLERLERIRKTYFDDPTTSFGKTQIKVTSQNQTDPGKGLPENVRVELNEVLFITLHVVGSNNNLTARSLDAAKEFFTRDAMNVKWLKDSFAQAQDAKAIVLAIQAGMFRTYCRSTSSVAKLVQRTGFENIGREFVRQAKSYKKPVLLIYGDHHNFCQFQPFPNDAPNIFAVQSFGDHRMDAVEVDVDTRLSFPFSVRPLLNPMQPPAKK